MLRLDLALPSGKRKHLKVAESSKVGDLKALAQQSLGHRLVWSRLVERYYLILKNLCKLRGSKMEII